MSLQQTIRLVSALSTPNQELINRIAKAIQSPPRIEDFRAGDPLFDAKFADAFGSYLQAWHFFNKHALSKKTFEYGMQHAFVSTGRSAEIQDNATAASYDIKVENERLSCKTETKCTSAKATISKFCEARWIGNCRGDRNLIAPELAQRFQAHTQHYSRILMLRAVEEQQDEQRAMKYTLHSLDVRRFNRAVAALKPENFSQPRNERAGCSARLSDGGLQIGTIGIDASVEKITISRINLDAFTTLFGWQVAL